MALVSRSTFFQRRLSRKAARMSLFRLQWMGWDDTFVVSGSIVVTFRPKSNGQVSRLSQACGVSLGLLAFFQMAFRGFSQISTLPCIDDSFSSILCLTVVASGRSLLLPHELQDHLPEHLGDGLVPGPA